EWEVRKTIESAYPDRHNDVRFFYGLRLPTARLSMSGPLKRALAKLLGGLATVVQTLMPRQCNQFAFALVNSGGDKPWITRDPLPRLRPDYRLGFDPKKYRRNQ